MSRTWRMVAGQRPSWPSAPGPWGMLVELGVLVGRKSRSLLEGVLFLDGRAVGLLRIMMPTAGVVQVIMSRF